jgi:catechol-2,3-dioxygenase
MPSPIAGGIRGLEKELAMAAPFNTVGIDHVVLRAADPAALERFYVHVLGLTFEARQGKLT